MSLKRRAINGVVIAGSLVMMCAIADATDTVMGEEVMQAAAETEMELATDRTAGVVALLNQVEADALSSMEDAAISIEQTKTDLVALAEEVAVENEMTEEEQDWQNRLMADVDEFLYVRADGDENAEVVGKLYKGAVAEIMETGADWTHIVSGNVDGYVKNDYCVTGEEALDYAVENVETEAEIQTDGLRVRSEADENAKVLSAVSTGTALKVDTEADTTDDWVAVKYGNGTAYVSAEYVTTDFALSEAVTIEEEKAALAKQAEEEAKAAQVSGTETVQKSAVAASVDEVTLLAALIQCEAGNECYEGQLAVGAVVMNRVRSGRYPGSVSGVIYESGQFTPAASGAVASVAANGPKGSCIQAAQEALAGADNTGGATCFRRASSGCAGVVIGNHVFF